MQAQAPTHSGVRFRHRFEAGEPEEVVARFVEDHDVDLVVAEEPPRTWISEALWRGLAERLVRRVACPVVIGGPGFLRSEAPVPPPVRSTLPRTTIAGLLNAMVDARAEALRCWMDQAADAVHRIASSPTVHTAPSDPRLVVELDEHLRALRAVGWQLTSGERVWGGDRVAPTEGRAWTDFLDRVARHGRSTSLPMAAQGRTDRLIVLSGAIVADGQGILIFAFDAEAEFLRILGQPGPLPSFETYAFDETGLMLSNSLFPDHLRRAGLLPAEGMQTPLRLRVAAPADGPIDGWPLTHMVQEATRNKNGFNTAGYRDYRGMPVVGAWRWIPEYGFGIAAEVDRDAAYRPHAG